MMEYKRDDDKYIIDVEPISNAARLIKGRTQILPGLKPTPGDLVFAINNRWSWISPAALERKFIKVG